MEILAILQERFYSVIMKENISGQKETASPSAIDDYKKQLAELVKIGNDPHFKFINVDKLEEKDMLLFGRYLDRTLDEADVKKRMETVTSELKDKKLPFEEAIKDSRVSLLAYLNNKLTVQKSKGLQRP